MAEVQEAVRAGDPQVTGTASDTGVAGPAVVVGGRAYPLAVVVAWLYLAAIMIAELVSASASPALGMVIHSILLLALLVHATFTWERPIHYLLLALTLAPLIRIVSMGLPLANLPRLDWYVLTSLPLFAGVWSVTRSLGLSWEDISIRPGRLASQAAVATSGFVFGYIEYRILRPAPLADAELLQFVLAEMVLLFCTGLLKEVLFRGLLQRTAMIVLGRAGVLYVALLFAIMHLGYGSWQDELLVLAAGLFFGWVVARTRSLSGVTCAHGLTNIILYLVLPLATKAG